MRHRREKTGIPAEEYLKSRLFDKIGIDSDNFLFERMPDGTVFGGGGFYATTEDNLRLMKLYKDGGVWDGERILSEEYVKMAISKQIDTATEKMAIQRLQTISLAMDFRSGCASRKMYTGLTGQWVSFLLYFQIRI